MKFIISETTAFYMIWMAHCEPVQSDSNQHKNNISKKTHLWIEDWGFDHFHKSDQFDDLYDYSLGYNHILAVTDF